MDIHPSHGLRRTGSGRPLVLVHGLGASHDCWRPLLPMLRPHRELVVMDLPGFGYAQPGRGAATIEAFTDHVEAVLADAGLLGADLVGSSMGGEIVLELLRRGHGGDVVALAPSGYWGTLGRWWFLLVAWSVTALATVLRPVVPAVVGARWGRELLLRPLSPNPSALPRVTVDASHTFARTTSFLPGLRHLGSRREPVTVPAHRTRGRRVTIGWGRRDGLCLPGQADRALAAVPGARLHWFDDSGHLPPWDEPEATAALLLAATGGSAGATGGSTAAPSSHPTVGDAVA